jgi:hypothetical protein
MPRNYSEEFLIEVHHLDAERLGVQFAKVCINANLPAMYVANALGVSRMTIYSWFRGKPLRDKNATLVKSFMKLINEAMTIGALPAPTFVKAKEFVVLSTDKLRPQTDVS